jgi:cation diffusion facilitator CzcD-associated flavoprotein CzcO
MAVQHTDALIIGAGLSGIGAAHHLQTHCPGKTFAILEGRERMGGTWDLFRYPGIRSDSDMYTLGYAFQPWREGKAIADGPDILSYVKDTAKTHGIDQKIHFNHWVKKLSWSSDNATWTVDVEHGAKGGSTQFTCHFLLNCTGYYRYDKGYTPDIPGYDDFQGDMIHPQHWPEDLDYSGKRVVVIGSGATAVTLVPAMTDRAAHVTMLQRSPTYIVALPAVDAIARFLNRLMPARLAYQLTRWKNVTFQMFFYQLSRRFPKLVRKLLRRHLRSQLGDDFDIDTHFNPHYNPWDQRVCMVPNGDLFRALRKGDASVVTDHIETITETGIRLQSGKTLEADIIVTATGLNIRALGGAGVRVDGREIDLAKTQVYKGMMLSGVPNLGLVIGYTNASWTLKADLTSQYACRLIKHMDRHGYRYCMPQGEAAVGEEPFLDLNAGYVLRALDDLPKQGDRAPWKLRQNYLLDLISLRFGSVEDSAMTFAKRGEEAQGASAYDAPTR